MVYELVKVAYSRPEIICIIFNSARDLALEIAFSVLVYTFGGPAYFYGILITLIKTISEEMNCAQTERYLYLRLLLLYSLYVCVGADYNTGCCCTSQRAQQQQQYYSSGERARVCVFMDGAREREGHDHLVCESSRDLFYWAKTC